MNRFLFFLLLSTTILFLNSCNKDNQDQVGYSDATIVVKTVGNQSLYGLNLHTFSLNPISSVAAYDSRKPAKSYPLSPFRNLKTEFFYETPPDSFSAVLPVTGDYLFKVKFSNGDTLTYINNLNTNTVAPPQIVKCSFDSGNKSVDLEWSKVENASFYNVKMYDSQGKVVFVSPLFVSTYTTYSFGVNSQGWQVSKYPDNNSLMTVEVSSYLLKTSGDMSDYQSVGRSVATMTWGG